MLGSKVSTRIAACTALVALTAASSAQAATVRTLNRADQTRVVAAAQPTPNSAALTFTRIDDPLDTSFNQLLGIDDQGVISGYFGSGAVKHPNEGYTIAPPYNTNMFVPDNLPSSTQTQATGITPFQTTSGFWAPTNLGVGKDANYGFIREVGSNGTTLWLSVNDPLVASTPKVNQVLGINKVQNAVGFYNDANNNPHGFIYNVPTGKFTHPFHHSAIVPHAITGINDNNIICGFFVDTAGNTEGFIEQVATGATVPYQVNGSKFTQFLGINKALEAVGFYLDANNIPHGIVVDFKKNLKNALTIVNDPLGANGTTLNGINDNHQAVGFYTNAFNNTHGLLVGNVP